MKKFALALMASAALVFGFGAVAQAQYFSGAPVTTGQATYGPGGTVTVTINGCTPGESLVVTLAAQTVTVICQPGPQSLTSGSVLGLRLPSQTGSGTTTAAITAPTAPGTYTGTVVGNQGYNATFTVVVAQATTPTGGLPATGSSGISTTTGIAIGLFAVGLGLLGVTQFRRRQAATTA